MHDLCLFYIQVYQFTGVISVTVCHDPGGVMFITNSYQDEQRHWTCVRELFVFYYKVFYNSNNQTTAWTQKVLINKSLNSHKPLPQKVLANKPLILISTLQ